MEILYGPIMLIFGMDMSQLKEGLLNLIMENFYLLVTLNIIMEIDIRY